ncbi:MAG: hypothetical protein Ct9H300mP18_03980 [Candidatus Neomarinimicrobiota bacterium]|nr:MAG: hypothetical protein Ct9H300mP18_03980 [Candidatus Neomarinimicrobiota bacterium]
MGTENKPKIVVAPSLLAADFSNLEKALGYCNNSSATWLHLDIMDQQFVPNLSFGPDIVKNIRKHSKLFFDVHLMVSNPFEMIDSFINAGADGISFHIEPFRVTIYIPSKTYNKQN